MFLELVGLQQDPRYGEETTSTDIKNTIHGGKNFFTTHEELCSCSLPDTSRSIDPREEGTHHRRTQCSETQTLQNSHVRPDASFPTLRPPLSSNHDNAAPSRESLRRDSRQLLLSDRITTVDPESTTSRLTSFAPRTRILEETPTRPFSRQTLTNINTVLNMFRINLRKIIA